MEKFKLSLRQWDFICAVLKLSTSELRAVIGRKAACPVYDRVLCNVHALCLNYYIQWKLNCSLRDLLVRSELYYSHRELAAILGLPVHSCKKLILVDIDNRIGTVESRLVFMLKTELPLLNGDKELSRLLKANPLLRWRVRRSLSLAEMADIFHITTKRLIQAETGQAHLVNLFSSDNKVNIQLSLAYQQWYKRFRDYIRDQIK